MKIYIAGPMSGLPESNRPAFHAAETHLTELGHVVLNPATLPDGLSQSDYMAICIVMLQRAEGIYMLNGWQQSAGARAEVALAEKLGLALFAEQKFTPGVCKVSPNSGFYQHYDVGGTPV